MRYLPLLLFFVLSLSTNVLSDRNMTGVQQDYFNIWKGIAVETRNLTKKLVTRDQITFHMFRKTEEPKDAIITNDNLEILKNTTGKIVFISHGWTDNGNASWVITLKDAFLSKYPDWVVITVDWHEPASQPYHVSAINVNDVANFIGDTINDLVENYNLDIKQFIVSGHSLGGQISGFTGKRLKTYGKVVSRIIAMDPAGTLFVGRPESERLNPTDAEVVVVLHTNGAVFGYHEPCGTIDFFPNGGDYQPGCTKADIFDPSTAMDPIVCDHERAYRYFTEAVLSRTDFKAAKCSLWNAFTSLCDYTDTEYLGNLFTEKTGKYYFKTNKEWPFSKELVKPEPTVFDKMGKLFKTKTA